MSLNVNNQRASVRFCFVSVPQPEIKTYSCLVFVVFCIN
jgi:hypothetical protein